MGKLSVSLEDYIEEIYSQVLKTGQAKVTDIAKALNFSKPSVTGALTTLAEKKIINYLPYSPITLTEYGEEIAKNILKKHNMLSEFFKEVLGISEIEASETACKMEHIISEKLFNNMTSLADFIKSQPDEFKDRIMKLYK